MLNSRQHPGSQFATARPSWGELPELSRYWTDSAHRARIDAETQHARELANDAWDARMEAIGNRWPAHWTDEEKQQARGRWNGE